MKKQMKAMFSCALAAGILAIGTQTQAEPATVPIKNLTLVAEKAVAENASPSWGHHGGYHGYGHHGYYGGHHGYYGGHHGYYGGHHGYYGGHHGYYGGHHGYYGGHHGYYGGHHGHHGHHGWKPATEKPAALPSPQVAK